MKKRVLSLLMVLVLSMTLLPAAAMAADPGEIYVNGVKLSHQQYLAEGSEVPQDTMPDGGYAHWDLLNGVLTLKDFDIDTAALCYEGKEFSDASAQGFVGEDGHAGIVSRQSMAIDLIGKNTISITTPENYTSEAGPVKCVAIGIYVDGYLTITGDALEIRVGYDAAAEAEEADRFSLVTGEDGIDAQSLRIISGDLQIYAGYEGLDADESVTIEDGTLQIWSGDDCIGTDGFTMNGGKAVLTSYTQDGIDADVNGAVIRNADLDITAADHGIECEESSVELIDSRVIISAGNAGVSAGGEISQEKCRLSITEHTAPISFADVQDGDWFAEAVLSVCNTGLMTGVGGGRFDPNGSASRAMVVTILWRLEGSPADAEESSFADVQADSWYAAAVDWAAANGIVEGANGLFSPNAPVTREQLAAILYRYATFKKLDVSVGEDTNILSYNDAFFISEYAIPAIQWMCGAGLLEGTNGNLMPQGGATRAQLAAILYRFMAQ